MTTFLVEDRDGSETKIEGTENYSLMELIRDADLPIEGICGGQCVCSTCHVYIEEKWISLMPETSEEETIMIEDTGAGQKNSRLACQIMWSDDFDGLRLKLAPEF